MANPQRQLRSESLGSEASSSSRSTDKALATSEVIQAGDHEDERMVRTATPAGDWIATAVLGLVFLAIIGVTAHFVGLIPTIAGALVIVSALVWIIGSALTDATEPWKFRG